MSEDICRFIESLVDFVHHTGSLNDAEKSSLHSLIETDGLTAPFWGLVDVIEEDEIQLPPDLLAATEMYAPLIDKGDYQRLMAVQHVKV